MKIELLPAFRWTCDSCGRENFGAAYEDTESYLETALQEWREEEDENECPTGFSDNEILSILRQEMQGDGISLFFKFPEEVTCPHCQETFETDVDPLDNEEEEEESDV